MADLRTSNYLIYSFLPEQDTYFLVHSYTGAVDKVTPSVVRYLLDHKDVSHTFHTKDEEIVRATLRGRTYVLPHEVTIENLREKGYLTDKSPEDERTYVQRIANFLHEKAVKRAGASFIVIPTYECNLRCPYCFEAETRVSLRRDSQLSSVMSREMADAMFNCMDKLIEGRLSNGKSVVTAKQGMDVCLYGGEPLCELTRAIVEYIVAKGLEQGMRFSAITNGLELERFRELLGPEKIKWLQITLDGPEDIHNKSRIGPSYRGTFDTILDRIDLALELGVTVSVRLHVNWQSIRRVNEVMGTLEKRGLFRRKNFSIYLATTHSWHRGVPVPAYPDMATHEVHEEVEKHPPLTSQDQKLDIENERIPTKLNAYIENGLTGIWSSMEYCHATTGMCIFDPLGKIYSCWDNVGRPGQEVGHYSSDGPSFNSRAALWLSRSPGRIPECSDCKYIFFHFGGCAAIPLASQGSMFAPGCYEYESDFITISKEFFGKLNSSSDSGTQMGRGVAGHQQALVQIRALASSEIPQTSCSGG